MHTTCVYLQFVIQWTSPYKQSKIKEGELKNERKEKSLHCKDELDLPLLNKENWWKSFKSLNWVASLNDTQQMVSLGESGVSLYWRDYVYGLNGVNQQNSIPCWHKWRHVASHPLRVHLWGFTYSWSRTAKSVILKRN